jgi:hypothetical protein
VFRGSSGVVVVDVAMPLNEAIVISTTLSIGGSLTSFAVLSLDTNASLYVNGTISINSALRVASGSVIVVEAGFTVGGGATLTPVITVNPGNASSISLLVARFAANFTGSFVVQSAVPSFPGSDCFAFGQPLQVFQPSSLSVSITVSNECSGGIPIGAIIGIAVGGALLGVLGIFVVILIWRQRKTQSVVALKAAIRERDLQDLSYHQLKTPR